MIKMMSGDVIGMMSGDVVSGEEEGEWMLEGVL